MLVLLDLFITFFQIGLFTIGGGYAMIPLITDKVVSKGWATKLDLLDYIAISESTPGPFAINTATFIGMKQFGVIGAVVTAIGLILPSFTIILIIAKFFVKFLEYKGVLAALNGLRPAVIGLMCAAVISIAVAAFNISFSFDFYENKFDFSFSFIEIIIFAVVFALSRIKKLKFNAYKILIASGVLGVLFYTAKDFVKL